MNLTIRLVPAAFVLALACCSEPRPPDIIVLTVDTLRADHVGAYGHADARTPVIDRIASEGALFRNAFAPQPRTTPALASLLTGLEPPRHGALAVGQRVRSGVLLAERLGQAGWTTLGVSRSSVASERQNLHRGFDRFVSGKAASPVTRTALELLAEADPAHPVFLWAHYMDPHFPYRPPEALTPKHGAPCLALADELRARHLRRRSLVRNEDGRASAARDACVALYDGEIAHVDQELGKLLDGLRSAGRLDHAYVVLTSDHGENLGEGGIYYAHGHNVHHAGLRIPLILAGPGVRPGIYDGIARLEDLVPTLLQLVGLPAAPDLDGWDLSGVLRGGAGQAGERIAIAESASLTWRREREEGREICWPAGRFSLCSLGDGPARLYDTHADPVLSTDVSSQHPEVRARLEGARARWSPDDFRERVAHDVRFKLVRRPRLEGGWHDALYDLEGPGGEAVDVAGSHPEEVARLGAALDDWMARRQTANVPEFDPETRKALQALGYAE